MRKITEPRYCTMEWCDDKLYARGLCRNCYEKNRRGTLVDPRLPKPSKGQCSFEGCEKECISKNNDLCNSHNMQRYLGKELKPLRRYEAIDAGTDRMCKTCKEWKNREEGFYRTSSGGPQGECKICMVKRSSASALRRKLEKEGVDV